MGIDLKLMHERTKRFQPTTWVGHWLVAWCMWAFVVALGAPFWLLVILLTAQAGVFFWREWGNYERHRRGGGRRPVWIADGVLDMVGPLTVLAAALGDPWVAHTFGFGFMALASIAWVALGWSQYGSEI